MKPTSNFKIRDDLQMNLDEIAKKYLKYYDSSLEVFSSQLIAMHADSYHFITQILQNPDLKNRVDVAVCRLLLKNIKQAELLAAGGGEIAFVSALTTLKVLLKNPDFINFTQKEIEFYWKDAIRKVKHTIEFTSRSIVQEEVLSAFEDICGEGQNELAEACFEAVKLAGLEGRIFVENGKSSNYVVELKEGYTFNLNPYSFFLERGKWDETQCKVLVVDGFVEAVSEIDQLLNAAFETKQPLVLISHGFSEEVVSTLFINKQKKKLNVIPIRLKNDVSSLNVINDIGVVCGTEPITPLKGQMLTFTKFESLPTVKRILVTEKETSIENPKSRAAAFFQVKGLLEKREDNRFVEDIQNILDGRIRSLSPNSVHLYLPDMATAQNESSRIKIDLCLRHCKSLLNYGMCTEHRINDFLRRDAILGHKSFKTATLASNEFESLFFRLIEEIVFSSKTINYGKASALATYAGILIGTKLGLMLLSSNGMIEIDEPTKV